MQAAYEAGVASGNDALVSGRNYDQAATEAKAVDYVSREEGKQALKAIEDLIDAVQLPTVPTTLNGNW